MPESMERDRELMAMVKEGSSTAVGLIVERWERRLFSFAYRYTQSEETTRDIVQETFVRVYHKRERYDPAYPFSS